MLATPSGFGVATTMTMVALAASGSIRRCFEPCFNYYWRASAPVISGPSAGRVGGVAVRSWFGSCCPDIDQPGSLLTRMPANQAHALQRAGARYAEDDRCPHRASLGRDRHRRRDGIRDAWRAAAPYNVRSVCLLLVAACSLR